MGDKEMRTAIRPDAGLTPSDGGGKDGGFRRKSLGI